MQLTELLPDRLSRQLRSRRTASPAMVRAPWRFLVDHTPWRRREPRLADRMRQYVRRARTSAPIDAWRSTAGHVAPRVRQLRHEADRRLPRQSRAIVMGFGLAAASGAAGAFAMYFADPHAGRRRRALMRDRFVHVGHVVTRRLPLRLERRMRFMRGVATGVRHDAAAFVHVDGRHEAFVDDETLVARVRSEVLRNRHVKAGEIRIDAYEGYVTLRGEVPSHEITELVSATARVEGVRGVRNYLHTPGSLPPNKAEGYVPHPMPMDGS